MIRAAVRGMADHLGRRGRFLAIVGTGKTCWGIGFLDAPPDTRGLDLVTKVAPLHCWAWLWIAAGVTMFCSAWVRVGRDGLGFFAGLVPPVIWAVSYLHAAVTGAYARGMWVAVWYLTLHVGVILWASSVPEHSVPEAEPRGASGG